MIRYLIPLSIFIYTAFSLAQNNPLTASEMQRLLFITEASGTSATIVNPAGLARRPADDGLYANYSFDLDNDIKDANFCFSIGNIGLGYQNFMLNPDLENIELHYYRIGLAMGGRIFSFGTSNKLIDIQGNGVQERVFSVDAGFIFEPIKWITLAGYGRNLDEPFIKGIQYRREYTAGISLNTPENILRILFEGKWNESTLYFEDADFKAGFAISPLIGRELDIIIGGIRNLTYDEQYFAMIRVPIWGCIQAAAAIRVNQNWETQRFFTALLFPLQTVTF